MRRGQNDDILYDHSLDHRLEFFSKAGSLFSGKRGRQSYAPYGTNSETTALGLFQSMWITGIEHRMDAFKLMCWVRDPRGGAGNRGGFRDCLKWLTAEAPGGEAWVAANMVRIPEYGRFDDLTALFGTPLEGAASRYWAKLIADGNHYALKWAKRDMVPLQRAFCTNEAGLRKHLQHPARATVETIMCNSEAHCDTCGHTTSWLHPKDLDGKRVKATYFCSTCGAARTGPLPWTDITYSQVPSVAMARYTNCFSRHDPTGFQQFKDNLEEGKAKVNASVLYPHDCLRTAQHGDTTIADQQFKAMPDYIPATTRRIMSLVDVSASMGQSVAGGSVTAMDVAIALGLYCSDRLGQDNPFYRKYMEFSDTPTFVDWRSKTFHESAHNQGHYIGSTNIQAVLDYLLSMARMFTVNPDQMINTLLILSDMQFDCHTDTESSRLYGYSYGYNIACEGTDQTVVEKCMANWEAAGYARPTIVYWNLAGYAGQPATLQTPNTGLVSGYSPAILESVLGGVDFDPLSVMRRAILKYEITAPA